MRETRLTVVISAGQSRNPEKRQLERGVSDAVAEIDGVAVVEIPHLYDLPSDGKSFQILRQIDTDLVVVSWMFARATHWVLNRNGVRGQIGEPELRYGDDAEDEELDESSADDATSAEQRVMASQELPPRRIFCLDFRASNDPADFAAEVTRILQLQAEAADRTDAARGQEGQENQSEGEQGAQSSGFTFDLLGLSAPKPFDSSGVPNSAGEAEPVWTLFGESNKLSVDEHPTRRWYPVIDYSRCTNCMECIDFCLFGVYGVDRQDTILVEQADNCRKGCPACSRVCPENAIIFPQHKTPAIAGAPVGNDGLKIDLSKLFGAPETDEDPIAVAARERDEQLVLAGRQPVGMSVGIRRRIEEKKAAAGGDGQPDELDALLDQLDSFDL